MPAHDPYRIVHRVTRRVDSILYWPTRRDGSKGHEYDKLDGGSAYENLGVRRMNEVDVEVETGIEEKDEYEQSEEEEGSFKVDSSGHGTEEGSGIREWFDT